jgi:hypothetical protein
MNVAAKLPAATAPATAFVLVARKFLREIWSVFDDIVEPPFSFLDQLFHDFAFVREK